MLELKNISFEVSQEGKEKEIIKDISFVIPDGVISISGRAFNDCKNLTSVKIGCSVKSIGNNAFSGCEKLKGITIPYSVTTIGSSAFEDCYSLTNIVIPDSNWTTLYDGSSTAT